MCGLRTCNLWICGQMLYPWALPIPGFRFYVSWAIDMNCLSFIQQIGVCIWRGYLMISAYSLSLPLLSLHLRNMTEASTLAGEKVLGSFSREITLSRMVLCTRTHTHAHTPQSRYTVVDSNVNYRLFTYLADAFTQLLYLATCKQYTNLTIVNAIINPFTGSVYPVWQFSWSPYQLSIQ